MDEYNHTDYGKKRGNERQFFTERVGNSAAGTIIHSAYQWNSFNNFYICYHCNKYIGDASFASETHAVAD